MNMSYSKKTMIRSLCVALCIVLPQALRVIPSSELAYKAVQIPVLLCGILCGSGSGLLCAFTAALVSAFISGVPTFPLLPVTFMEFSVMGLASGILMKLFSSGRREKAVICSLVPAVLLGRISAGVLAALLFSPGQESMALWTWAYFVAGLPAFIVQLVLIPTIVKTLEYSGFINQTSYTGSKDTGK